MTFQELDKHKKIGIVGHFGEGHDFIDGQTVKTRTLFDELTKIGYTDIYKVDTYLNNVSKLKLLRETLLCIFKCKTVIVLLSRNGMKIYFPLLFFAKKLLGRKVYHDVIGGNLAGYVDQYPKYRRYLNGFDGNWVEFEKLKKSLAERNIDNCTVIPNFKRLDISKAKIDIDEKASCKLCMFSRVMKEKGMTDAIEAVHKYNESADKKVMLEIWGQIDDCYKQEFEGLMEKYSCDAKYMGKVKYSESVEVLTNHLALLFPTYWNGEGFPGTIVDAYASALPVIASDWNANGELIDNFSTGFVYPNDRTETLYDSIKWAMEHKTEMSAMRKNCIGKAGEFMPDNWISKIEKML